jgi:hypothetical protein
VTREIHKMIISIQGSCDHATLVMEDGKERRYKWRGEDDSTTKNGTIGRTTLPRILWPALHFHTYEPLDGACHTEIVQIMSCV